MKNWVSTDVSKNSILFLLLFYGILIFIYYLILRKQVAKKGFFYSNKIIQSLIGSEIGGAKKSIFFFLELTVRQTCANNTSRFAYNITFYLADHVKKRACTQCGQDEFIRCLIGQAETWRSRKKTEPVRGRQRRAIRPCCETRRRRHTTTRCPN